MDLTGDPSEAEEEHREDRPNPRPRPLALQPGHERLSVSGDLIAQTTSAGTSADYERRCFCRCTIALQKKGIKCPLGSLGKDLLERIMDFESPGTVPFKDFMLHDMAARFPGLLPDGVLPGPPKAFQAGDVARATARANAFVEWLHQRFENPDALASGYAKGHGPLVSSSQLA
jgi:hypothetical protein